MGRMNSDYFLIEGLNGRRTLSGEIAVGGAKNAALKMLAASILFRDELSLSNVPNIEDVCQALVLLQDLGVTVNKKEIKGKINLVLPKVLQTKICPKISKKLRASIVLTGPLLARMKKVSFPFPGGCVIGKRPIDIFLDSFEKMGAKIKERDGFFELSAPDGLRGTTIFFRAPSVTATETLLMAATLAKGTTILKNCAIEPEIEQLGLLLKRGGADIRGLGTPTLEIRGSKLLSGAGFVWPVIPDRIEAGSYIILGALVGKDLTISNIVPEHLDALFAWLEQVGVNFSINQKSVRIFGNRNKKFKASDIKTHEYPGFPTDLQAPASVLLTQAVGQSFIFETIFEGRLNYLEAFNRMGAQAKILDAHRAIIDGPTKLNGRELESPDLRAGLAYVLGAIVAEGRSIVHNVGYIDRGYEKVEEKLRSVGVSIKREGGDKVEK